MTLPSRKLQKCSATCQRIGVIGFATAELIPALGKPRLGQFPPVGSVLFCLWDYRLYGRLCPPYHLLRWQEIIQSKNWRRYGSSLRNRLCQSGGFSLLICRSRREIDPRGFQRLKNTSLAPGLGERLAHWLVLFCRSFRWHGPSSSRGSYCRLR